MTTPDPVREAFENWFRNNYSHHHGGFGLCEADLLAAWQAALSAPPPQGWRVIGHTTQHDLDFPFDYPRLGRESGDRNIPVYVAASPPPNTPREE